LKNFLLLTFATHRPSDRTQLSLLRRDAKRSEGVTPKAKQAGVSGEWKAQRRGLGESSDERNKHLDGTNLRPRSRKRYSSKQTGEPCHQNFRVLGEQTALTIRLNNHSKRQSVAPLGDRTQAIAQGGISSALQTPFTEASW